MIHVVSCEPMALIYIAHDTSHLRNAATNTDFLLVLVGLNVLKFCNGDFGIRFDFFKYRNTGSVSVLPTRYYVQNLFSTLTHL